jgi:hypothetical protein
MWDTEATFHSSSSRGPSYFCGNATYVASTCPAVGGSFSGNTSLAIYDPSTGTQMNSTSSSVDGCYICRRVVRCTPFNNDWDSWPSIVSGTFSSDDDVWYYLGLRWIVMS